jgi:hypothetical protein
MTPIPIVTVDNAMKPRGICFVHVVDTTSNIGPQKKPKPLNENKTINNLLIGANAPPGQISPFSFPRNAVLSEASKGDYKTRRYLIA